MKKKFRIIGIACAALIAMLILGACGGSDEVKWDSMEKLDSIEAADITSIEYSRAGEGGVESGSTSDATEIEDIRLRLKDISLAEKTDESVLDDDLYISVNADDEAINFSFMGDIAVLDDGSTYKVENLPSLKSYINTLIEESGPAEAMQDASDYKNAVNGVGSYDIAEGMETKTNSDGDIEYIYFNDFMVIMPNNDKWSFDPNGDSVTFYLFSAQQEGYGGKLVTIRAYALDDDSYENLPSYQVAGVCGNANVRLVAIYPTDLQYNASDATQKADYEDLFNYLKKIGEGAVNSPLQVADGNSAP